VRYITNTARSEFTASTYFFVIFRRRFLNISEAPRTVKCHQVGVSRPTFTGTASFFWKSDSVRYITNTARSEFTASTYFFVIFRRRFLNISEAPRTVKCHQSWRLAVHVHGHGAVFSKIGLSALHHKHGAKWIHGIDSLFRHFPPPFFGILLASRAAIFAKKRRPAGWVHGHGGIVLKSKPPRCFLFVMRKRLR
jgi:hypothetical protein